MFERRMVRQIEIRPANVDDSETLAGLYAQLESNAPPPTSLRIRFLLERLRAYPDYRVYLAFADGRALGTFALLIMDTLGDRCAPEAIVEDLVVDRDSRGSGIGRAMMEFAMKKASASGCYKLVLSSNLRREDAHAFYESLGFKRHGYSFLVEL